MELTLEQELGARTFLHKVAIVKSAVINSYIADEIKKGGITLSFPCIEQNAVEYSDQVMSRILGTGKLDEAYDNAWNIVGKLLPDNFSIM